jgi:hypothetical protein
VQYWAVANAVAETTWLRQLLGELHSPIRCATLVYCDNVSVVYLWMNPVQHQRTKHIKIDLHFIRDKVTAEAMCVLHVPTSSKYEDIFTEFRSSPNVLQHIHDQTGGCVRLIYYLSACLHGLGRRAHAGPSSCVSLGFLRLFM